MSELGPSPLTAGDPQLSVAQAREAIRQVLRPITDHEPVALTQGLGRVLAADLISPIDVPAHDNSALRLDERRAITAAAAVLGRSAGAPLVAGQCLRIMTGARCANGCDTVVPQELPGHVVSIAAGWALENRAAAGRPAAVAWPWLVGL
jgi:molybdopterin molybdotransferase